MTGSVAALIVLTPLAIGAVNRGAFVAMEAAIFALVLIWMVSWTTGGITIASNQLLIREARHFSLPLIAMTGLLIIQLTPMPPQILGALSPTAYHVHQIAFRGWPSYGGNAQRTRLRAGEALHSPAVVGSSSATTSNTRALEFLKPRTSSTVAGPFSMYFLRVPQWRPLTLSPVATSACLLESLALTAAFFLLLLYPFGVGTAQPQIRFLRVIPCFLVSIGALVALIGIAQRASWNGRILWFYQPVDWSGPLLVDSPRASGPFVDPDHFANYLALILPLAVAGALFPRSIMLSSQLKARLFFAAAASLMLIAVALSLSRGGWIAAGVGVTSMLAISFRQASALGPAVLRRLRLPAAPLTIVVLVVVVGLTLYVIGGPGRSAVTMRIVKTSEGDFSAKIQAWRETLTMIKDFPLFGVGAGAWPEIFPRYQLPPESRYFFFRTAENDYLQFVAENGIAGLVILLAMVTFLFRAVVVAAGSVPAVQWPLLAGLLGGVVGGLVQEFVDSSLHIPANALLFAILLALLLRVMLADPAGGADQSKAIRSGSLNLCWLLAGAAALLIIVVLKQDGGAYPYDLDHPANIGTAVDNLDEHPAMSAVQLAFARLMADASESQRIHLAAAVWLEPNEPVARDLLARNLLLAGRKSAGLAQLSTSVYRAPFLDVHYYLAPAAIPWLLPEEQQAIAHGFSRAIDDDFGDAASQLASFYLLLGRERDAAEAYEHGARANSDSSLRLEYLLKAGGQYGRLHDYSNGARTLLMACSIAPEDSRPYAELAQDIYGPEKRLAAATAITERGIKAGGDPYTLELALASAAEMTGGYQVAAAALNRALQYDPSLDGTLQLGRTYLAEDRFERAITTLQQATELNPQSAEAFTLLGRAFERNYDYYHAEQAFGHAVSLAPSDQGLREEYRQFQRRAAQQKEPTSSQ
jgi:tetratricopeptide (TPR) repeat protein/O-antigen ligase